MKPIRQKAAGPVPPKHLLRFNPDDWPVDEASEKYRRLLTEYTPEYVRYSVAYDQCLAARRAWLRNNGLRRYDWQPDELSDDFDPDPRLHFSPAPGSPSAPPPTSTGASNSPRRYPRTPNPPAGLQ